MIVVIGLTLKLTMRIFCPIYSMMFKALRARGLTSNWVDRVFPSWSSWWKSNLWAYVL